MSHNIPLSSPDITQIEIDAVTEVMRTRTLSIGPKIEAFEAALAQLAGRRCGVGVSSGTAGLHCCVLASGITPDHEVITTPFSFVASTNCILYAGAKPVFVDIDPKTLNIDLNKIEAALTPQTRAIVGVEAFGHPGGMPELEQFAQRHELILLEDSCEGIGAQNGKRPVGSFGRASVFAFYPNKQITTGEGGMILTDDEKFAAMCRSLRNQGREGMSWLAHQRLGYNYRMSEINAALGIAQVSRIEQIIADRRRVANAYINRLMTSRYVIVPTVTDNISMSWFVFVVRLSDLFAEDDRDFIIQSLRSIGIGCSNYFPPIHLQPYIAKTLGTKPGDFPICEYVSARTIALPFFNKLTEKQIDIVVEELEKACEKALMNRGKR